MRAIRAVLIHTIVASFAGALVAAPAAAQARGRPTLELRPFVGSFVPIGALRRALGETVAYGGQGAMELSPGVTVVGAFALARPHDLSVPARPRLRMTQLDLGLEWTRAAGAAGDWTLKPFVGAGVGGRAYSVRETSDADRTETRVFPAGYASLGTELQAGRLALRAEARGYASGFVVPSADAHRRLRADALLAVGFAYHLR